MDLHLDDQLFRDQLANGAQLVPLPRPLAPPDPAAGVIGRCALLRRTRSGKTEAQTPSIAHPPIEGRSLSETREKKLKEGRALVAAYWRAARNAYTRRSHRAAAAARCPPTLTGTPRRGRAVGSPCTQRRFAPIKLGAVETGCSGNLRPAALSHPDPRRPSPQARSRSPTRCWCAWSLPSASPRRTTCRARATRLAKRWSATARMPEPVRAPPQAPRAARRGGWLTARARCPQ